MQRMEMEALKIAISIPFDISYTHIYINIPENLCKPVMANIQPCRKGIMVVDKDTAGTVKGSSNSENPGEKGRIDIEAWVRMIRARMQNMPWRLPGRATIYGRLKIRNGQEMIPRMLTALKRPHELKAATQTMTLAPHGTPTAIILHGSDRTDSSTQHSISCNW